MWLSVDPLADKNISNTPYMYCNGNPVMLIDPDGMDWYYSFDENGVYEDLDSRMRVLVEQEHIIQKKDNNQKSLDDN